MTQRIALFALLLAPALLAGCASSSLDRALEREEALHERLQEREAQYAEQRQAFGTEQLETLPEWVITKPRPDGTGMYGVGIGESPDLTQAIRKSNLQARFDITKEVNLELSAEETLVGSGDSDYRYIVNSFVKQVDMTGVEDVAREIQSGPRGFRIYTLVKLPYREFNQALASFGSADGRETVDSAYKRLMDRVRGEPEYVPQEPVKEEGTETEGEKEVVSDTAHAEETSSSRISL